MNIFHFFVQNISKKEMEVLFNGKEQQKPKQRKVKQTKSKQRETKQQ